MISLSKLLEPRVLVDNKDSWTADYLKGGADKKRVSYKYSHEDIKGAIVHETSGKCAYCEGKVRHVCPGDIEHIVPSAKHPELRFQWTNLTLACPECNRRKGDYYEPAQPLVNPYTDDPVDHVFFAGPMLFGRPQSHPGRLTVGLLELNRPNLMERRCDRLKALSTLAEKWADLAPGRLKDLALAALHSERTPDKEFSAMVGQCVEALSPGTG